jgi:hypothetical protein
MPAIKPAPGENPYAVTADWTCYCDLCGEKFRRKKKTIDQSDEGCFCSRSCRYEYSRREEYGWHCAKCGTPLEGEQEVYCSDECVEWARSWDDHYPVGQSTYRIRIEGRGALPFQGALWEERRSEALERDGYRCLACGISRREHRRRYRTDLSVHHRTPRRQFDTADEAHDLENLATLCSRCHGWAEAESIEAACNRFFEENESMIREIVRDEIEKVMADA